VGVGQKIGDDDSSLMKWGEKDIAFDNFDVLVKAQEVDPDF